MQFDNEDPDNYILDKDLKSYKTMSAGTRTLIYYSLKSLQNEIRRVQWSFEIQGNEDPDLWAFYNRLLININNHLVIIEHLSDADTLTLTKHFSPIRQNG